MLLLATFLAISSIGIGLTVIDGATQFEEDNESIDEISIVAEFEVFKYYGEEDHSEYAYREGLEGWTFELFGSSNYFESNDPTRDHGIWAFLAEGETNETGIVTFVIDESYMMPHSEEDLAAVGRDYHFKVREVLKDGWYFTGGEIVEGSNEEGSTDFEETNGYVEADTFWLYHGESVRLEFGNAMWEELDEGCDITVFKFHDVNATGEYDPEIDVPLEDWYFELFVEDDEEWMMIDYGYTDEDGYLVFEDYECGVHYRVKEYLPEGWYNTVIHSRAAGERGALSIQNNNDYVGYEDITFTPYADWMLIFGNAEGFSEINVYKFHDENYDGEWDNEEELIDGFYFQLWEADEAGEPVETIGDPVTTTDGTYTFEHLAPGDYIVQEIIPEVEEDEYCWVNTTPLLQHVNLPMRTSYDMYFGNVRGGSIEGMKFLDIEATGEFEVGVDRPLMGWEINLWTAEDGTPIEIIETTETNRDGMFYFDCVAPGEYFVQEEMYDGWYNVTPALQHVYVEPEETVDEVNFANCMFKDIYGIKFYDYNMTGEFDEEDWVIEGWEINLWNEVGGEPGEIIETTYTQPNGYYYFEDLKVGAYYVQEALPEGWDNTTPSLVRVELNCCSPCRIVNFGNYEFPEITINKFYDTRMTGEFDEEDGDYLIYEEMVNFDVYGEVEGLEVFSETFGVEGSYNFYVPVGDFQVTEHLPEGWINTTDLMQYMTLGPGDHWEVWFGNVQYGEIEVYKFYDENMDGYYNKGEEMLEGWTFNLWTTDEEGDPEEIIDTQVTDEYGVAYFEDVVPDDYIVQEELKDGWFNTTELLQPVTVEAGEVYHLWFGNVEYGEIRVWKFYDENMDGNYESGYEKLPGWTFNLWTTDEEGDPVEIIDTQVTGDNGAADFLEVKPGEYIVQEILQECWFNTTPLLQPVTVEGGERSTLGFGNVPGAYIGGYKYCDYNLNQEFDDHEYGLEGWTINLWVYEDHNNEGEMPQAHHEPYMTTTTDEHGYYNFTCVRPGRKYIIEEVIQDGWYNSTSYYYTVEVWPEDELRYDFGNYRYGDITGIKFYDFTMNGEFEPKEGDIPLRGREVQLWTADEEGNPTGEGPIYTTETDAHGIYMFEDVGPGDYVVYQPKPCCDWIHTTPRQQHVRMGCVEEEIVNFGEYKYSSIDVYLICGWEGIEVMIYESDEYGEKHELLESGYTGEHGWYISEHLAPGYYIVELGDGQYEHVQLRMGEQVEFEYDETPESTDSIATYAKFE